MDKKRIYYEFCRKCGFPPVSGMVALYLFLLRQIVSVFTKTILNKKG